MYIKLLGNFPQLLSAILLSALTLQNSVFVTLPYFMVHLVLGDIHCRCCVSL